MAAGPRQPKRQDPSGNKNGIAPGTRLEKPPPGAPPEVTEPKPRKPKHPLWPDLIPKRSIWYDLLEMLEFLE